MHTTGSRAEKCRHPDFKKGGSLHTDTGETGDTHRSGGEDLQGIFLVHNDNIALPNALTYANNGSVAWRALYTSFGVPKIVGTPSTRFLLRFPGQWDDGASLTYQNAYREYDPHTGRYTTVDPLGDRPNPYAYANQSPGNIVDNLGLKGFPRGGGTPLDHYLSLLFINGDHGKGGNYDIPQKFCSSYMTQKMKGLAEFYKTVMEKDLEFAHDEAVAECSLIKLWTLEGEKYQNEHEVFTLKGGFDGLIANCATIRTSSCCCATTRCGFSMKRVDEYKDPNDHFPSGSPREYEDEYNYFEILPGKKEYRNWFRFTIECPTGLTWKKSSCA